VAMGPQTPGAATGPGAPEGRRRRSSAQIRPRDCQIRQGEAGSGGRAARQEGRREEKRRKGEERRGRDEPSRLQLGRGPPPPPGWSPATAAATGGGLWRGLGGGAWRPPCRLGERRGSLVLRCAWVHVVRLFRDRVFYRFVFPS